MKTSRTTRRVMLLLIAVVVLAAPGLRADHNPWPQTLTGTWIFSTSLPPVPYGPGGTVPGMAAFNEDGTLAYTDALMFGGGGELFPYKVGPFHGVWRMTGPNRFGGTSIGLLFDLTYGYVAGFVRARSALRYDGSPSKITGTLYMETLMCANGPLACPDPTDPAAAWVPFGDPVNGFPVALSRVTRVPAGPLK